jgi:hypothetical protein
MGLSWHITGEQRGLKGEDEMVDTINSETEGENAHKKIKSCGTDPVVQGATEITFS